MAWWKQSWFWQNKDVLNTTIVKFQPKYVIDFSPGIISTIIKWASDDPLNTLLP